MEHVKKLSIEESRAIRLEIILAMIADYPVLKDTLKLYL
jgi:hypothetical protein